MVTDVPQFSSVSGYLVDPAEATFAETPKVATRLARIRKDLFTFKGASCSKSGIYGKLPVAITSPDNQKQE